MPVISVASTKGGVGKTTICQAIGTDLALEGYRVALLDADRAQNLTQWGARCDVPGAYFVSDVDESNVVRTIREFRKTQDFVFVDLPGEAARVVPLSLGRSDLVILPAQPDEKDARAAVGILATIRQTEDFLSDNAGREVIIPYCGLITKVHNLQTRAAKHTRDVMEDAGIPVLGPELIERTVFHEMSYHYRVPRQLSNQRSADENIRAVRRAVLERLGEIGMDLPAPVQPGDLEPSRSAAAADIAG